MANLLERDDKLENKVIVDTNLLLDDSKILFKLTKQYKKIVIPITVLKELDKHKFKPNTSFSAREAIRALKEFKENFSDKIEFDVGDIDLDNDENNDAKIIKCARNNNATLATKDMSMGIIAEAQNLKTKLYDVVLNNLFNPYLFIEQDVLFEHNEEGVFGYGKTIDGKNYDEVFNLFKMAGKKENLSKDSWFFVIINTPTPNPTIYANNPIKNIFQRIDNDPAYCEINDTRWKKAKKIKARDIYQKCAIYALKEAQHVLITGRWGSGKTLLSTAEALNNEDKKIFVSRAPIGLNSKYNIGFVPGPQPLDAKILTPTGWTTMGKIKKGDYVITSDGEKAEVLETYDKGIKDVYTIETTNGGKTRACGDHLWATKTHNELKHNYDFKLRSTLEIKNTLINENSGDKYNHTLPMCDIVQYDSNNELPIKPYTMGVLLGDGSFSNSMSFSSVDDEIVNRVESEIKEYSMHLTRHNIYYTISGNYTSNKPAKPVIITDIKNDNKIVYASVVEASKILKVHKITLWRRCKKELTVDGKRYKFGKRERWQNYIKNCIYKLGLEHTKANTKFIPEIYKRSSVEDRISILQGLMDTDGTIKATTGEQSLTTISKRLAEDVIEIARSLGMNATYYTRNRIGKTTKRPEDIGDIITRHISYEVSIPKSNNINIFHLSRKANKVKMPTRNKHVKIKDIIYNNKEAVKCIKINSEKSLYITDDFIVTHNTKEDKMQDWLAGFMSALYYLYSNTRGQQKDGEGYDYVKDVLFKEKLEPLPMNSIQGLSLLDNDTLIVDEVQLIDVSYMSMILSRPSESGRLILLGDLAQTYDVVKPSESGLLKLLRVLPHKSIAYVDLKASYRSDILEVADLLQDKTIG
jgi:predicted ribonuclease YlaK